MSRAEVCRRALDSSYQMQIGQDLRQLQGQVFHTYRCPVHRVGMVLARKNMEPRKGLDGWYFKCHARTRTAPTRAVRGAATWSTWKQWVRSWL